MGIEQTGITRASILNALGVVPEANEVKMFIACATLAPRIRAVVGEVAWDIAAVNSHDAALNRNAGVVIQRICIPPDSYSYIRDLQRYGDNGGVMFALFHASSTRQKKSR